MPYSGNATLRTKSRRFPVAPLFGRLCHLLRGSGGTATGSGATTGSATGSTAESATGSAAAAGSANGSAEAPALSADCSMLDVAMPVGDGLVSGLGGCGGKAWKPCARPHGHATLRGIREKVELSGCRWSVLVEKMRTTRASKLTRNAGGRKKRMCGRYWWSCSMLIRLLQHDDAAAAAADAAAAGGAWAPAAVDAASAVA